MYHALHYSCSTQKKDGGSRGDAPWDRGRFGAPQCLTSQSLPLLPSSTLKAKTLSDQKYQKYQQLIKNNVSVFALFVENQVFSTSM